MTIAHLKRIFMCSLFFSWSTSFQLFMGSFIEIRPSLAYQRSALGRGQQWRRSVDMMDRSLVPLCLVDSISYNALLASYLTTQMCPVLGGGCFWIWSALSNRTTEVVATVLKLQVIIERQQRTSLDMTGNTCLQGSSGATPG